MHLYLKKKLILPQENNNYNKVSFEWSNHRSSTTETAPCESKAEEFDLKAETIEFRPTRE